MFEKLDVFRMAHSMAVHAGQKQAVAAQNVANADTPGYKAMDVVPFAETYNSTKHSGFQGQRASRALHLNGTREGALSAAVPDQSGPSSPNGNNVSLENEMLKSLGARRQHDRALAIYKSSMTILRATLSRS